jgi:hypothetical protein
MSDAAVRLPRTYDPARLRRDLDAVRHLDRAPQPGPYHDGDWTGLSLYSQGGRPGAHPGYAGLDAYRETEVLARTPYFKEVLDSLDCGKRVVRLLALPPGAEIGEHTDAGSNFQCGSIRLHVPIVTHEKVIFTIDGERVRWREGELWYGDFARPHWLKNESDVLRVHLVIDVEIDEYVLGLFPADFVDRRRAEGAGIALRRTPIATTEEDLRRFECSFRVPGEVMPLFGGGRKLAELAAGAAAEARVEGGRLVVSLDGSPSFALERVAEQTFSIVGLTAGYSLEVRRRDGAVEAVELEIRGLPEDLYAAQLGYEQGPPIGVRRVPLPIA